MAGREIAGILTLAAVAVTGAFLVASDDAEATHFWSGTLSWEPLDPLGLTPDSAIRVTGYLGFDTDYPVFPFGACDKASPGIVIPGEGSLTVDGTMTTFNMLLEYVDPNPVGGGGHCRFSAKIIGPESNEGVIVPIYGKSPGDQVVIKWSLCCREDDDHVNNANKYAAMETRMNVGDPNTSPIIDFPHTTRITDHGPEGYGNHHCPKDSFCKFYVEAADADNDTLTWRLATAAEPGGSFKHPGAPWTGPFEVDPDTGLVTWDTTGASVGEIYSSQIIVEDPLTFVPVDFMVEIGKGCENGAKGVVDPFTGELICEFPPETRDPPARCQENPDDDGCNPVPPRPPEGKAYEHTFWPAPRQYLVMPAAVSDSEAIASGPGDSSVSDVSGIDSDGDTITDGDDRCPGSDTPLNNDMDNDGLGDGCDIDDDGDGIPDEMDACPLNPDADCATLGTGMDAASGTEASRGFFQPSAAPQKADARARLQASDEATSMGGTWIMLVGLAAAMLVLLLVAARRRG